MLTPFLISSDPPSGRRHWHSPDPFHMSSHRRTHNGHFDSNLYIRELEKNCALSRIHFVSILMCSRSARRLPLAPPTMAPPFQRDGFRLHSFLPPDWHGLPKFVDALQLRVPGHVHCCRGFLPRWTAGGRDVKTCQPPDARPRLCANIKKWGHHHDSKEHRASVLLRASNPRRQYRTLIHCVLRCPVRSLRVAVFRARPGPHAKRHTARCAMYGHGWHHARAVARGCGKGRAGAGVVAGPDDARRAHVVGLALSASARGAPI